MRDESLLFESTYFSHQIARADGETLRLTRFGIVDIMILARGAEAMVTLTEVYLEPRPETNVVFY